MDDTLLFLLFFVALALGWVLGRSSSRRVQREQVPEYYKGINYLLNDRPDKAVDALVSTLELDSDSFGAHLMLGSLFRQRGELAHEPGTKLTVATRSRSVGLPWRGAAPRWGYP